jgi:hypothetical protein
MPLLSLQHYPIDERVVALLFVSGSLDVLAEKEAAVYRERALNPVSKKSREEHRSLLNFGIERFQVFRDIPSP